MSEQSPDKNVEAIRSSLLDAAVYVEAAIKRINDAKQG
jgi:hypothetical protein